MDATTWNRRTKARPVLELERVIAWSFVAIAHLLLAWLATRISVSRPITGSPMELVFIQLPPTPPLTKTVARARQAVSVSPMTAQRLSQQEAKIAAPPASDQSPARSVQVTTVDDQWSNTPEPANKRDGISFERNQLTTSFNPIRASAPQQMRLRRQFSPRDVLRAVSQALFWPPGYTDDPCIGLAKAVEIFSAGTTAREHILLADAALQQSTYCH